MAGNKMIFDNFQPIFGEAHQTQQETSSSSSSSSSLRPFLFHAHAAETSRLRIAVTDFHSNAWERTLTAGELDDLRDEVGIGGSWAEFLEYLVASLSSSDVKLNFVSGDPHAKLIAHKSKGLPRISLTLNRLMSSSAKDAMADFSLVLFQAFKNTHDAAVKDRESLLQLKGILSCEKERTESLQKQLDAFSFVNKRKVHKSKALDKASTVSVNDTNNNSLIVSETNSLSAPVNCTVDVQGPSVKDTQPIKVSHRAAPASRRTKARGVSLQDAGSDDDS